jgi:tellurite resistance protein
MLLIWGFRALNKTLAEGEFFCPQCGGDRPYRHRRARRWFTLFFIPVIPLRELGEYVECRTCGAGYDPGILAMPTTATVGDQLSGAMRHLVVAVLRRGTPASAAERQAALTVLADFLNVPYGDADLEADLAGLELTDLLERLAHAGSVLSEHGREAVLAAVVWLAGVDGPLDGHERPLLEHAGAALGMSPAHVAGVMAGAGTAPRGVSGPAGGAGWDHPN